MRFDCLSLISSGGTSGIASAFPLQRGERVGERTDNGLYKG